GSCDVFVGGDVAPPHDGTAGVVGFLDGQVGHEALRGGAVPVVLAGLEIDAVAGADDLDGTAAALAAADALGDVDRLAEGVGVPGGTGAGREMDHGRAGAPRRRWRGDGVDVDGAGEPVAWPGCGLRCVAGDLH